MTKRVQILMVVAAVGFGLNLFVGIYSAVYPPIASRRGSESIESGVIAAPVKPASILAIARLKSSDTLNESQLLALFEGGSDSLVARTIGPAEGTRTSDGTKTQGWYGHSDPGDGRWNVGTFSYNNTRDNTKITDPEAADKHYLQILKSRAATLFRQSKQVGISLTLQEWINAIDLSNQAPQPAVGWTDQLNPGFIANLAQFKRKGIRGENAVLKTRIEGFRNTRTGKYEAWTDLAGLKRDQTRRMLAASAAMQVWQQQQLEQTPVAFNRTVSFSNIESQNPYGHKWNSIDQQTQALYWQMGAWDGINQNPAISSDPSYQQGYQFGFAQSTHSHKQGLR